MKYGLLILVIALTGCNYAAEITPDKGPKVVASIGLKPDQVSLGEKSDEGPPKTTEKNAGTEHTKISKEEADAQVAMYMIAAGIGLILLGIGLMVARHYTAGIAVPSWVPRKIMMVGAGIVAWGSVPSTYRAWIVGFIVIGGLFWMYYGSKNNNHKLQEAIKNG